MELARNEQGSGTNGTNDTINNNGRLLSENEQSLGVAPGSGDLLGSQHLGHQQQHPATVSRDFASSEGSSSLGFLSPQTAPQHQQTPASHHSIPSIPEDRTATGLSKHPSSDGQNEGCSPDQHSSAPTTGTTSTPTSVGNSSTPPSDGKAAGQQPGFPSDSLRPGQGGSVIHGQANWPPSLGDGMMGTPYEPGPTNPDDSPEVSQYNLSPTEAGRYSSASFPCAIKLLVSNNVAGSIIGRAGQTISDLQAQSSTRIKLSQTGDYYPGSQDRVCLVQGQLDNVKGALSLLLERLYMLQEHQHSQHMAWQSNRSEGAPPFDFVVRILVPSSSCGMIIGKSGSNIRQMEEASGVASVRLSPKDIVDPNYPSATISSATSERVVTLTGPTLDCCLNCLFIILDGMTSHPDICRYTNMTTSYSRIMPGPFVASQPTLRSATSGEHVLGSEGSQWNPHYVQSQLTGLGKRVSSSPDLSAGFIGHRGVMPLEPRPGSVGPHTNRDNLPYSPMFSGPSSTYSPLRPPGAPPGMQRSSAAMYLNPHMDNPVSAPVPNSASAPDLLSLQLESMHLVSSPQQPPPPPASGHQDYPLFPAQLPGPGAPVQAQILVPDNMIGSILGRGGRTLNELQVQSGTRIRISQRGEYLPGTRNRIVTVRGPTEQSVSLAQFLMNQRMILPRTATYQVPMGQSGPILSSYSDDQGHMSDHHPFHHPPHLHPETQHAPPPFQGPPSSHPHHHHHPPSPPSPQHPHSHPHQGPIQSRSTPAPTSTETDHSSAT